MAKLPVAPVKVAPKVNTTTLAGIIAASDKNAPKPAPVKAPVVAAKAPVVGRVPAATTTKVTAPVGKGAAVTANAVAKNVTPSKTTVVKKDTTPKPDNKPYDGGDLALDLIPGARFVANTVELLKGNQPSKEDFQSGYLGLIPAAGLVKGALGGYKIAKAADSTSKVVNTVKGAASVAKGAAAGTLKGVTSKTATAAYGTALGSQIISDKVTGKKVDPGKYALAGAALLLPEVKPLANAAKGSLKLIEGGAKTSAKSTANLSSVPLRAAEKGKGAIDTVGNLAPNIGQQFTPIRRGGEFIPGSPAIGRGVDGLPLSPKANTIAPARPGTKPNTAPAEPGWPGGTPKPKETPVTNPYGDPTKVPVTKPPVTKPAPTKAPNRPYNPGTPESPGINPPIKTKPGTPVTPRPWVKPVQPKPATPVAPKPGTPNPVKPGAPLPGKPSVSPKPSPVKAPEVPGKTPTGVPGRTPSEAPAVKPITKPVTKPNETPAVKPAPGTKPAVTPLPRPITKPGSTPGVKPITPVKPTPGPKKLPAPLVIPRTNPGTNPGKDNAPRSEPWRGYDPRLNPGPSNPSKDRFPNPTPITTVVTPPDGGPRTPPVPPVPPVPPTNPLPPTPPRRPKRIVPASERDALLGPIQSNWSDYRQNYNSRVNTQTAVDPLHEEEAMAAAAESGQAYKPRSRSAAFTEARTTWHVVP